ncbi:M36 family metallopeptidase [Dokdonella sp.]|uniref:M36 family metallopeptidase n=1 Tax=Dokdonella sp. TaxID=2291710 RepID=UPI002F416F6A
MYSPDFFARRRFWPLALVLACAQGAIAAAPATNARFEPIHLDAQSGWLPADADAATPKSVSREASTTREAIVAAAQRALAGDAKAARVDAPADAARVHATRHGPFVVQFPQRVDGVEVYGARVAVLLDRSLEAKAVGGGHSPHAAAARARGFHGDPMRALRVAAGAIDGLLAASPMREAGEDASGARRYAIERSAGFVPNRPATVKPVWYPARDALLPAFRVEIAGHRPGVGRLDARALIVGADDDRVLSSTDLVHDLVPFSYRVFAGADGVPYGDPFGYTNPYPTRLPSGYLPDVPAPMNLVTLSHAGIGTGDPWLADDAATTSGNNVDAFFNADPVDEDGYCTYASDEQFRPEEGDFRAPASGPHAFDYAYDVDDTLDDFVQCDGDGLPQPIPTTSPQLDAKIVQAFYATNWLHDLFYDLGYDEEAGNMQVDNHGRGGIGGDPLLVSAAYAATFTLVSEDDGNTNGALFLGANVYSQSNRDVSALDFGVLAHEWSHTMFGRLTRMAYAGQQGALNEGIADFVGLLLGVRAEDRDAMPDRPPFYGNYAIGAYMNRDYDFPRDPYPAAGSPGRPDDTYYHGIRRFPHSADLAINPLTFASIGMDHPLPDSLHAYDWKLRSLTNAEIHTAGEMWTEALWQCSRGILAAAPPSQFEPTRDRILADLVASLKLIPADADYTEARNALLAVIRTDSEADYRRCRSGFAERGLGAGAVAPGRYSIDLRGAVESFEDAERALGIVDVELGEADGGDGDGVLDRGERGVLRVTVQNTGFSPLGAVRVKVGARASDFAFPRGAVENFIALAPGERHVAEFDVRVLRAGAVERSLSIDADDRRRGEAQAHRDARFRVDYDLVRDRSVDTLAAEPTFASDWTSGLGDADAPDYCYVYCATHWHRDAYASRPAYVIGDVHAAIDAHLATQPFAVSASMPLRVVVRHDYAFDRLPADTRARPGRGTLEVSVDGGEWTGADAYLAGGSATFTGASSGWRDDTLDFGSSLAGHVVRLRWHARIDAGHFEHFSHWAIGRVEVQGAEQPMFSRVVADRR